MLPCLASIAACAMLPAISISIRVLSKWMDALNSSTHSMASPCNLPPHAFSVIEFYSTVQPGFDFGRQAENFNETDRSILVECILFCIRRKLFIIEAIIRASACDSDVTFVEGYSHFSCDRFLHILEHASQRVGKWREPESIVHLFCKFLLDDRLEMCNIFSESDRFKVMLGSQNHFGTRRFIYFT